MKTIILNDRSSLRDLHTYGSELLGKLQNNYDVVMYDEIKPDFSNISELFDDSEKLVMFNHFAINDGFGLFSKQLPKFKNIKYLLSPYSAYEGLDLELLKKTKVKYRNNGGANAKSVAQYAVGVMFMLLHKTKFFIDNKKMPGGSALGDEFFGKSAGIIGMGNVGQELLEILNSLGIKTVCYNRTTRKVNAKKVAINDIFNQDLVFVTIATNKETKNLLKDIKKLIQPHNYLIDVSATDDLYDKKGVIKMLVKGKFKGFALEAWDPKALVNDKDLNLIVTPHIAWCTIDAEKRTVENYLNRALTILREKRTRSIL